MIPEGFNYHRATSVDEAIELLKEHEEDGKLLAGGHSLLPAMKLRLSTPGTLIDIGRLSELNYIREEENILTIGAGVTHHAIETSAPVQQHAPALAEAAAVIGDPQIRNMGTLGGSLAHADPNADYPAPILAVDAIIRVKGPNGSRDIEAADYLLDLFLTDLQPDEIITEVRIPIPPPGRRSCYLKFPHPASRFAVVGCAVSLMVVNGTFRDVRVAFTGIANAGFRDQGVETALSGKAVDEDTISAAAAKAAQGMEINSDAFAGEDYRRHLARVFAARAIRRATSQP